MGVRIEKYVERESFILDHCRGKRVLHLGCVAFTDSEVERKIRLSHTSLHTKVSGICDCTGLDIDEQSIKELQARGIFSNVRVGNVEHLEDQAEQLGRFDVVLAGDIIEHLSNPGRMLDGIHSVLRPDGEVIISTNNAQSLPAYVRFMLGKYHEGAQHVMCFNTPTLDQMVTRHGYKIDIAATCYQRRAKQSRILFPLASKLLSWFPHAGGTLIFVCKEAGKK